MPNLYMDSKIVMFTVLALASVFALMAPLDVAVAQTTDIIPDGDGEYKDGSHEGKSCPSKEKKTESLTSGFNI